MEKYGANEGWASVPILLSRWTLSYYGFKDLKAIDDASQGQILRTITDDVATVLVAPNGATLYPSTLLNFAFELIDLPIEQRQRVTQHLLLVTADGMGAIRNRNDVREFVDPAIMSAASKLARGVLRRLPPRNGVFTEQKLALDFMKAYTVR